MRSRSLLLCALSLAPACAGESDELMPVSTMSGDEASSVPSSADAARRSDGFVRFVQAIPDVASVDVYANDMRIFSGAAYGTVTAFRELPDASYTFRIRGAGDDMAVPMAVGDEGVTAGRHYTVVAIRKSDSAKARLVVFADELVPPAAGMAMLRLVNASPDAGELDLYTPGAEKPLFSDVDFEKATAYEQITAMVGQLDVRREDEKSSLILLPATSFEAGKVYTVIVLGWTHGAKNGARAVVVEDRFGAP
jgi:hypothetical protein